MTAAPLDAAAIMAEHLWHVPGCETRPFRSVHHGRCETYRLAADLAAAQAKVQEVRDLIDGVDQSAVKFAHPRTLPTAWVRTITDGEAASRAALAGENE